MTGGVCFRLQVTDCGSETSACGVFVLHLDDGLGPEADDLALDDEPPADAWQQYNGPGGSVDL